MPFIEDKTGYFRDAIDELHRMTNKHHKLKDDLRTLVEYLEDKMSEPVSAREAYQDAADRVEELLGGE